VLQGGFQGLRDEYEVADSKDGEGRMHAALVNQARKQLQSFRRLPVEAQRRRMVGWLQRRGYSWTTCQDILDDLGVGVESSCNC
jgi:SOS response regulatory protein OraA/RecX